MRRVELALLLSAVALAPRAGRAEDGPVARLGAGAKAFRAGDYAEAARQLGPLERSSLHNKDWALYLLGESRFYDGAYASARSAFGALERVRGSRLQPMAPWRMADCLWMEGRRRDAVAAYRRLLARGPAAGDAAVARFRLAEMAATPAAARAELTAVVRDNPGHPLVAAALRRLPVEERSGVLTVEQRLRRAEQLSDGREWQLALDELAQLPAQLGDEQATERDFVTGMTKYRIRRDYGGAAELLLKVAPRLKGERAATAAFHGARALSRADRDDEAIQRYAEMVRSYPHSRWAPEAQFRSGWLEFNRGRYREGLPALARTVEAYPKSEWADDAAWYLTFARYLLDEPAQALTELDRFARLARRGPEIDARIMYWRSRFLARMGKTQESADLLHELVRRWPLGYYGLLARTRLGEAGEKLPLQLPRHQVDLAPVPVAALREPVVLRAEELLSAGLDVEAGKELELGEKELMRKYGAGALRLLLERYPVMRSFARAYQLAESRGAMALGSEPEGAARLFWQAAYPRAYRDLVEPGASVNAAHDLFIYSIMRKESGFKPHDVSVSDARGLLQMIPPTSARVAAALKREFFPDELFTPDVNVQLASNYIGSLHKKFRQQPALTAGAYNAGPRAMMRWCKQNARRPLDEFVELIAFNETREYVKRVMGIYARYQYLYGPAPGELSLKVDASFLSDGPDF